MQGYMQFKTRWKMTQQIMMECPTDPDDQEKTNEFILNAFSKCKIGKAKTAQALQDAGTATSERDAARQIAEDSEQSEGATRLDIQRGRKELARLVPPTQTPEITQEGQDERKKSMEEPILCKECNERIAVRRMKNGKWYYTSDLCEGCRNEANGKPRIKKTKPKQNKQEKYWRTATKMLKSLTEYMLENCQTPNGLPENIKEEFLQYFDTLEVFENELR